MSALIFPAILTASDLPLAGASGVSPFVFSTLFFGVVIGVLGWQLNRLRKDLRSKKNELAEEDLRVKDRLNGVLDQLPVPLFFQDADQHISFVNKAMAEFFGKSPDDFRGERLSDFLPDEAGEGLLAWEDPRVLREESVRTQQITVLNQYDESRKVTVSLADRLSESPYNKETVGVMIDNTEGVNALQAMQDSLDLMTKVTSQVPGVVFEFERSATGRFSFPWASVGLQKVFEVSPLDVESDASVVFDRIHPEDLRRLLEDIEESASSRSPLKGEYRLRRLSDVERWILVDAIPEADHSGGTLWHGFTADITDIKEIENRLLQATAEAERANKAKSAFLAAMSHEIRTPMNGVIGMTSLLAQTQLNDEQSGYVNTIRNSGDALIVVINDILDFSKIESGHLDLEVNPFDVSECIEGVVDILAPSAAKKGLSLAYFVDREAPSMVDGDVMRIRQILVNLVGNAIKFTSTGQVFVYVDLVSKEGRSYLRVAVEDSGPGIPQSRKDRLFKPFSQVDASTSRVFGGTGLGLAISKRLAELMHGDLSFESVEGEGSSFYFLFPVSTASSVPRVYSKFEDIYAQFAGSGILILDRCPLSRELLGSYANAWGLQSMIVENGCAALQALERPDRRCCCLLVDPAALEPELPPPERAAFLESFRSRGLQVIEMNPSGQRSLCEESLLLAKPFKASQLLEVLYRALSGDRLALNVKAPVGVTEIPKLSGDLRILLAEDNPVNQKVALMMLKKLGLEAKIVVNGKEALNAMREERFDVILMDVQMPVMDGLEATQHIRKLNLAHEPWIIGLTANATIRDRDIALEAGMDNYLAKPIKLMDLSAALVEALPQAGLVGL